MLASTKLVTLSLWYYYRYLCCMGVDMIYNVGELDDHCVRSARKISTQLLKMPQKCTFGGEIILIW